MRIGRSWIYAITQTNKVIDMNTNINRIKREQMTCRCGAYSHPHRLDSKACRELYNATQADQETSAPFNPYVEYAISGLFAPDNSVPLRNPL